MLTAGLLASIPSPSSGSIHIGSLQLRMYGLMIALGVIAAVWLFGRRLEQKSIGTRDDAASIALWAVPAGVIGARLYHVITDWQLFRDDPVRVFYIWEGGLGIWGGIALGVAVGLWRAAKKGHPAAPGGRLRGTGAGPGPGHRAVGQLVEPGAVRPADGPAVGAGDLAVEPARRATSSSRRSTRRSSTRRCGTWGCAWRCWPSTAGSGSGPDGCS